MLVLNCMFEDLLESEPGQVMLEWLSHMNDTFPPPPLIAVSHYCFEICSASCISKGLEITPNIYVLREDTYWQSNSLEGSISYVYCEFREDKIYSSLSNKLQEIKNK